MVSVGINGFGRIGRLVLRAYFKHQPAGIDVVAVNDPFCSLDMMVYLLKYDSVHGRFPAKVTGTSCDGQDTLQIGERTIRVLRERDPASIPWSGLGVTYVIEGSGAFRTRETAAKHLSGGASKVLITAPSKGSTPVPTFVCGVNLGGYTSDMAVVSNASCTTNCLAPIAKVLQDRFGIETGLLNTIHAYTNTQAPVDAAMSGGKRLSRACGANLIPSTTGAAKAVGLVIPALVGRMTGLSIRVPVPDVSIVDFSVNLSRDATLDEVLGALREAAAGPLTGILAVSEDECVSGDFTGDTHSAIVDAPACLAVGPRFFKIIAYYDNEFAYSCRVLDLLSHMVATDSAA